MIGTQTGNPSEISALSTPATDPLTSDLGEQIAHDPRRNWRRWITHHQSLLLMPFVIFGVFRYLYLVYWRSEGGEPDRLIWKDKPLLINTLLWLLIMIFIHKG